MMTEYVPNMEPNSYRVEWTYSKSDDANRLNNGLSCWIVTTVDRHGHISKTVCQCKEQVTTVVGHYEESGLFADSFSFPIDSIAD